MKTLKSFMSNTQFTQSIVAEMCFVDTNQIAFNGGVKWKMHRQSMLESGRESMIGGVNLTKNRKSWADFDDPVVEETREDGSMYSIRHSMTTSINKF